MQNSQIAILWDLDGTIIDSKECHYNSWKAAFDQHGFSFSRTAYEENFGRNNQTAIRIYLGFQPESDLAEAIIEEKESIFREHVADQARLVPGVKTWLAQAKNYQFPQVIASSAPMKNIHVILEGFDLQPYFAHLVSGANLPAKPDPDVFLKAARRVGYPPENCLVIEDSKAGVLAGKNAAMRCIAVASGNNEESIASADLVLEDFTYPFGEALTIVFGNNS